MISENSAQNEKFHATLSELLLTSAQVRRELSKSRESVRQLKHIVQTWKGNNLHEADDNKTLRKPKSLEQGVRAVGPPRNSQLNQTKQGVRDRPTTRTTR